LSFVGVADLFVAVTSRTSGEGVKSCIAAVAMRRCSSNDAAVRAARNFEWTSVGRLENVPYLFYLVNVLRGKYPSQIQSCLTKEAFKWKSDKIAAI